MTHRFHELLEKFESRFQSRAFPDSPAGLYDPAQYILDLGGKRLRPVLCLMGNELFGDIQEDAYQVAAAVELFHNFTLIHDDIMDKAPLRRGKPAVHHQYGADSALLAGDVMLVSAYEKLNTIDGKYIRQINEVFNRAAREVCEGQQLDMDLAALALHQVKMPAYMHMIMLKTSVLLAASLKMGGIIGGGGEDGLRHLYAFGKCMGIAFQIHDDYLDAFGNPDKFGKQVGGDILVNKKTFLLLKAGELCGPGLRRELDSLLAHEGPGKVERMLGLYRECKVDEWAKEEKRRLMKEALDCLEKITVPPKRKLALEELLNLLLDRER